MSKPLRNLIHQLRNYSEELTNLGINRGGCGFAAIVLYDVCKSLGVNVELYGYYQGGKYCPNTVGRHYVLKDPETKVVFDATDIIDDDSSFAHDHEPVLIDRGQLVNAWEKLSNWNLMFERAHCSDIRTIVLSCIPDTERDQIIEKVYQYENT